MKTPGVIFACLTMRKSHPGSLQESPNDPPAPDVVEFGEVI